MSDDLLSISTLPPFATVAEVPENSLERGEFSIICGSLLRRRDGPLGLTVGLDVRQVRYWLPFDHPRFSELAEILRRASDRNERLSVTMILEPRFILDVEEPRWQR